MINTYWPVYKNLESQFTQLMFDIHIDDDQLDVYSLKISDLILRTAVEIESITRELYISNQGPQKRNFKFDVDGINHLNQLWNLEKKAVIISSSGCFLTNKVLYPFVMDATKTLSQYPTYGWNNSYQNIKHDRANSLKQGCIRHLLNIMAALYVLNIYFRDETLYVGMNPFVYNHLNNLGSEVFSINFHVTASDAERYIKFEDFDDCIYLIKLTEASKKQMIAAKEKEKKELNELLRQHPKYLKFISENDIKDFVWGVMEMIQVLGFVDFKHLRSRVPFYSGEVFSGMHYEAVPNKNNL